MQSRDSVSTSIDSFAYLFFLVIDDLLDFNSIVPYFHHELNPSLLKGSMKLKSMSRISIPPNCLYWFNSSLFLLCMLLILSDCLATN